LEFTQRFWLCSRRFERRREYLRFVNAGMVFAKRSTAREADVRTRQMMDPKLALLFVLIATIVGLSHASERRPFQRQTAVLRWRRLLPLRRRS
jgi:hypothetical protein